MGEKTKISWTDRTFNVWHGCVEVSPACTFCYAKRDNARYHPDNPNWGKHAPRLMWNDGSQRSINHWNEPVKWNKIAEKTSTRSKVFCMSMGDILEILPPHHPQFQEMLTERMKCFRLMIDTPWLDWLVLTKRPENARGLMPFNWFEPGQWPSNVWFGVTVEDEERADERMPILATIPAPVKWLSCEPLFSYLDLSQWKKDISWIITGGESGSKARPGHPNWYRALRDFAIVEHIPFFFKQHGEWAPIEDCTEGQINSYPYMTVNSMGKRDGCTHEMVRIGRQAAGHMLDGVEWHEFPESPAAKEFELCAS